MDTLKHTLQPDQESIAEKIIRFKAHYTGFADNACTDANLAGNYNGLSGRILLFTLIDYLSQVAVKIKLISEFKNKSSFTQAIDYLDWDGKNKICFLSLKNVLNEQPPDNKFIFEKLLNYIDIQFNNLPNDIKAIHHPAEYCIYPDIFPAFNTIQNIWPKDNRNKPIKLTSSFLNLPHHFLVSNIVWHIRGKLLHRLNDDLNEAPSFNSYQLKNRFYYSPIIHGYDFTNKKIVPEQFEWKINVTHFFLREIAIKLINQICEHCKENNLSPFLY